MDDLQMGNRPVTCSKRMRMAMARRNDDIGPVETSPVARELPSPWLGHIGAAHGLKPCHDA
ncbi:hypothetical protein RsS62_06090 [Rhizobium dioscoreae]|nr:hypothetical protein RsS62_06090 [Rhizobium dioscoreae]